MTISSIPESDVNSTGPLAIDIDALKDRNGDIVAVISSMLEETERSAYLHVFADAHYLFKYMDEWLAYEYSNIEAIRNDRRTRNAPAIPQWVQYGVRAMAIAEGKEKGDSYGNMLTATSLQPLLLEKYDLKDPNARVIATLNRNLESSLLNQYANLFIASVYLLDVIDFEINRELTEMKREYDDGLEFCKDHEAPADEADKETYQLVIPEGLRDALRLIAHAKGREAEPSSDAKA